MGADLRRRDRGDARSSPRRPTCSGTASPRSRPSTRGPARTPRWPPRRTGSPPPTTCAPPRWPPATRCPASRRSTRTPRARPALVAAARHRLAGADDPELTALEPRLSEVSALLADAAAELTGYLERLDADPDRLDAVLSRQAELKALTRKYAADVDGVLAWARQAERTARPAWTPATPRWPRWPTGTRSSRASWPDGRTRCPRRGGGRRTGWRRRSPPSSAGWPCRTPSCGSRSAAVRPGPTTGSTSMDGGWRPARTASTRSSSGSSRTPARRSCRCTEAPPAGELSRVMLALEVVLAGADPVPTMVFDEVDAGVGGRAAVEVGRRLARLARQPPGDRRDPPAAGGGVRRPAPGGGQDGRRPAGCARLPERDRIAELARMLAGLGDSDTGRAHAEELLATAAADRVRPDLTRRLPTAAPRAEPARSGRRPPRTRTGPLIAGLVGPMRLRSASNRDRSARLPRIGRPARHHVRL